ncbi:MAG: ABC transporter substrate-binding protein, partial [Oscillochloris sp.]|nr:ABC transporter substrate-binding protein [Oscillochloris sp.]
AAPAAGAPTAAPTAQRGTLRLAHTLEWAGKEVLGPASPVRFFPPVSLLYNRLVRVDESGRPAPDLAVSWEADPTATQWTFKLREGVTFHDGRPFSAQDVLYTTRYVMNPELESPGAAVLEIVDVEQLRAPDDMTVVFTLKQPHADFPLLLLHYSMYIIPDGIGDEINTTGIGTGPFKLTQFAPEGTTIVTANDEYWDGPPGLAAIEMVGIADGEARTSALLADQIDYNDIPPETAELVSRNANYNLISLPAGGWLVMAMRADQPPFTDPRVRMAMKLVVDRDAMVKTVVSGYGQIATDHPVWPGDQYYLEVDRQQDIARARELLAEAGYADGLDVTLYTSSIDSYMIPMTVAYKEMAAQAGINVTIQQESPDGYWNDIWLQVPFCCSSWGEREADQVLNEVYRSTASWNETFWKNAEFDGLLDQARRELDFEKRKAIYQQAQQLLADDGGAIIPFFTNDLSAAHKRVRGVDTRNFDWARVTIEA